MKDPKAHYLFPAYQLAADEWRSLTEDEPADHHEMIEECLKDCKEFAHTMINLLSDSGDYMRETMEKNINKFPFKRFLEDEEWMDEMHRGFAAVYIDKRTVDGKCTTVDIQEIEEDFEYFFQKSFLKYIDDYFMDEDLKKVAENPEKLVEIYAELEGEEVEDLDACEAEYLNKLSKLYPVLSKLDDCIELQRIQQIVQKTIRREIDFPRSFGRKIDIEDLPELFSMNLEDDGDLLRELKQG